MGAGLTAAVLLAMVNFSTNCLPIFLMIIIISFMVLMIKIVGSAIHHSIFEWLTNQCLVKVIDAGWIITTCVDMNICKSMMTVGNSYSLLILFGCWSLTSLLYVFDPESFIILCLQVPSYISRSVAGSYDNEAVAIFALIFTFYLYIKVICKSKELFLILNDPV